MTLFPVWRSVIVSLMADSPHIDSCALYYFSSTGNSLAVALEIARCLGVSDPISIPGSLVLSDPYAASRTAQRVGFVFPVHRATLPEMVRGFIEQMPVHEGCYYFAVSTHTLFGMNEFGDIDEILRRKGALLNYGAAVRMMGNVGLKDPDSRVFERRQRSMEAQVAEIAEVIGNRQENYFRRSVKLLGRLVKAFTERRRRSLRFRVDERCTRCGVCAAVCPARNITVEVAGTRAPIRSDRCEACLACVHWCPARALSTTTRLHGHYHHPKISPEQLKSG